MTTLVPLRELLSWEKHTNFRITSLAQSLSLRLFFFFFYSDWVLFWCKCLDVAARMCVYQLKQCVSYRVAFIPPCPWFLSRFVLRVAGRFVNPASTSSPPSSSSSPTAAALIVRAPWSSSRVPRCWRRVVSSGPAVKNVIPGTGAGAVQASSCPAATMSVQWILAVAPGNASRPGRWRVTPTCSTSLVTTAEATAAALAGARGASLGCRGWDSNRLLLSYWWKCDNASLSRAIIKGRDHTGRSRGKRDGVGHVLGRRWHLLHVVWWRWHLLHVVGWNLLHVVGWRWLGLMGKRPQKKKKYRSKYKWQPPLYCFGSYNTRNVALYYFLPTGNDKHNRCQTQTINTISNFSRGK